LKRVDARQVAALLAPGLLLVLFALGGGAAFWATLDEPQRQMLGAALNHSGMVLMLVGLGLWALGAWGAQLLYQRHVAAAPRLLEQAQVRVDGDLPHEIVPVGSAPLQGLAQSINQLVRQRTQLRQDMALKVAEASQRIDQERGRLAALMSELTQSVVVCNLDGRILLYNQRARVQFRALSSAPSLAGGAELIGLGRSNTA
jgi:DNA polymerase III subunit epsilon